MKISKRTKFFIASIIISLFYIPLSWLSFEIIDSGFGKRAINSSITLFKSIFLFLCLFIAMYCLFKIDLEGEKTKALNYVKMPQFIRSMITVILGFLSLFPFFFWFLILIY
ncbi:hypothetical protein EHO65_16830 [Leptospira andrefontaineae]|uniref:Uncharacterized protein n=1 Tax=Leptospira andrefontaineae TaxID=2484976 RepID=A0A4R9GZT2_9LEPT|nr:hypothetical protein EHO65_16830 [Leptospira andrefontaineae]